MSSEGFNCVVPSLYLYIRLSFSEARQRGGGQQTDRAGYRAYWGTQIQGRTVTGVDEGGLGEGARAPLALSERHPQTLRTLPYEPA